MTAAEARAMADDTIAYWRYRDPAHTHVHAYEVWGQFSGARYPGGGWERVRAEMIRWAIEQDEAEQWRKLAA